MKQLIAILLIATINVNAQEIHLLNTFHIQSEGRWDYIAIEPNSNNLFVSHGNQVNIIDKTTGDSLGIIPNTMGVHGIALFYKNCYHQHQKICKNHCP